VGFKAAFGSGSKAYLPKNYQMPDRLLLIGAIEPFRDRRNEATG
jgi:hypothetical protein